MNPYPIAQNVGLCLSDYFLAEQDLFLKGKDFISQTIGARIIKKPLHLIVKQLKFRSQNLALASQVLPHRVLQTQERLGVRPTLLVIRVIRVNRELYEFYG
jgi:hypothetical protein